MPKRRLLAALAVAPLVASACGDDDGIAYEGVPGTPVAAEFQADVPLIRVRLNGGDEKTFLSDTGAPLTIVNGPSFPGRPDGKAEDDIEAFALTFPGYTTATWAIFAPDSGIDGILGGDLLRHFAFSLDYRDGRTWLSDPFDPAAQPADLDVEPSIDLPIEVLGGGRSLLPGCGGFCGTIDLPATRVIMQATFEADPEPVWVLVDSGASAIVLDSSYFASLGNSGMRPELHGVTVGTVEGNVDATLSRVWGVELHGESGEARAIEADVPVLVIPGTSLLIGLSMEVDRDIKALIGGSVMRRFFTTFDYPERRLRLARYVNQDHIPANEYVSVGFSMQRFGDDWIVSDVYDGTDADTDGLFEGDVVDELAMTAITGQPPEVVGALLSDYQLGQEVPVGIRGPSGVITLLVLVEDLLPSYTMP